MHSPPSDSSNAANPDAGAPVAAPPRPSPALTRRWLRRLVWLLRRAALVVVAALATFLSVRAFDAFRGPPLDRWHREAPDELSPRQIDRADWDAWMAAEERVFTQVRREVTELLPNDAKHPYNRYWSGSVIYPPSFDHDWNRSFLALPEPERDGWDGPPIGAVVFLHGLTDSPYSLRHVADDYRRRGFVTVQIRLPGHGTVPAALTSVGSDDWMAATRLAVRTARAHVDDDATLHVVGFSLGGALAVKYALEALDDDALAMPDRLVLISPMIGVTRFARFAGIAGWPAILPPFARAAWLGTLPEFNPFKYNSFPVQAGRESHLTSVSLQRDVIRRAERGELDRLPPIITFQSILDATTSTPAVLAALYAHLPDNGSELVIFDVNRTGRFDALLSPGALSAVDRLAPTPPLRYRLTLIGNDPDDPNDSIERTIAPGLAPFGEHAESRRLGLAYPANFFSLSHVAMPFPLDDSLYGIAPRDPTEFGVNLGALTVRGERNALIVHLDAIFRVSSNPFLPYLLERVGE